MIIAKDLFGQEIKVGDFVIRKQEGARLFFTPCQVLEI